MTFLRIAEFAEKIGVTTNTLRNWERKGWLLPHHKTPTGYRVYTDEQVDSYLKNGLSANQNSNTGGR